MSPSLPLTVRGQHWIHFTTLEQAINTTQAARQALHPLASLEDAAGKITFLHNGVEQSVTTTVSSLTGDRMTWWNNDAPYIGHTIGEIRKLFKRIRSQAVVVSEVGDFLP